MIIYVVTIQYMKAALDLLEKLNTEYVELHEKYEDYFWNSYMGDHSKDEEFNTSNKDLEAWKTSATLMQEVEEALADLMQQQPGDADTAKRLGYRKRFFSLYQTPPEVLELKNKITDHETVMQNKLNSYERGYIDPTTHEKVATSKHGVLLTMSTNPDEAVRKACFEALREGATILIDEYIALVQMRNEYAQALGYKNFYYYKADMEESMNADRIFEIFDAYYEKTKGCLQSIRDMESGKP